MKKFRGGSPGLSSAAPIGSKRRNADPFRPTTPILALFSIDRVGADGFRRNADHLNHAAILYARSGTCTRNSGMSGSPSMNVPFFFPFTEKRCTRCLSRSAT